MRHWLIVLCVLRVLILVLLLVQGGMLELLCLLVDTIFLLMVACLRCQLTILLLVWVLERSLEHGSLHSVGTLDSQVVCCAENDFLQVVTTADPGTLVCGREEPVSDAAGQARTCSFSRTHDVTCLNSRIHESQSSSLACAHALSGGLFGARGVGAVSAALGSACLPVVRTRSYAHVAAFARGVMAVKHEHARNSVVSGGFLPVQKSTSYNLNKGRQGPTWRRGSKGGDSGPVEDLRPVSEVEAGVNFRLAGGVRRQVAGSLPRLQPGAGTRQHRVGVVIPSLHPEVPGIQFVSPGRGLRIRQSMAWTKVCGTAQSGIWVLKGNARTCLFPANLDHLGVEWIKQGTYKTAWVTLGHDCL